MYLEFLFLISDYFRTLKRRYVVFEWVFPFALSCAMFYLVKCELTVQGAKDLTDFVRKFSETAVTLLGILIGFSVTVITILNSSDTENIRHIKEAPTDHFIGKQKLFLFHLLLINLTYAVVIEILSLLCNLCFPWILEKASLISLKVLVCIDFGFILHVLLLNLRNITDFYFVLFKGQNRR